MVTIIIIIFVIIIMKMIIKITYIPISIQTFVLIIQNNKYYFLNSCGPNTCKYSFTTANFLLDQQDNFYKVIIWGALPTRPWLYLDEKVHVCFLLAIASFNLHNKIAYTTEERRLINLRCVFRYNLEGFLCFQWSLEVEIPGNRFTVLPVYC